MREERMNVKKVKELRIKGWKGKGGNDEENKEGRRKEISKEGWKGKGEKEGRMKRIKREEGKR